MIISQAKVHSAWSILNGYAFPGLRALPEESQQAIAITRLLLPEPLGRGNWERWLSEYQQVPAPYQLYSIQGSSITLTNTSVLPQRLDVMRTALTTPPAWKSQNPHATRRQEPINFRSTVRSTR